MFRKISSLSDSTVAHYKSMTVNNCVVEVPKEKAKHDNSIVRLNDNRIVQVRRITCAENCIRVTVAPLLEVGFAQEAIVDPHTIVSLIIVLRDMCGKVVTCIDMLFWHSILLR